MSSSTVFSTPGTFTWTLPANIDINTPLNCFLYGASGGNAGNGSSNVIGGGGPGNAGITLSLAGMTPGVSTITVTVGGKGGDALNTLTGGAGGFNGGGAGGSAAANGFAGGGGGGASDIRVGGTGLANRVVVAAGGGGGGAPAGSSSTGSTGGFGGPATGEAGHTGTGSGGTGGGGGTAAAGGAKGTSTGGTSNTATAGASGVGGVGGPGSAAGITGQGGGGGGGGYFGGGGGGSSSANDAGGGGGGSNYVGGGTVTQNARGTGGLYNGLVGQVTLSYNLAPNQPTLTGHANGDDTAGVTVAWTFSDPDSGDTQSKADVQWRVGGGAWTTIAAAVTTAQSYHFAANTFAAFIGQQVEWQVRTYDGGNAVGPWSASSFFTARTESAVVPTLALASLNSTTPTVTVAQASGTFRYFKVTVTDTVTSVTTDYGWQDAGALVTSANFTLPAYAYVNARNYTFKTQTSPYTDVNVPGPLSTGTTLAGNLNAPLTPTIVATVNANTASVAIAITNPGSDPNPPTINRVYRTDLTNNTPETRLSATTAINGTFIDWQPALNTLYRYRVEAVSAAGGATSSA